MKKVNFLAAFAAAVSFCGGLVLTSCSDQKYVEPEPKFIKGDTEYITETVTKVIDNIVVWDGEHILYNGATALTARVAPDSLTLTKPAEQHKAADIKDYLGDLRWTDTNGNAFTGTLKQTSLEGLELTAAIEPAAKFSDLIHIHPKVSMVKGQFNLVGMATLTESGKSKSFTLPVADGTYFLCDTSVTIRTITDTQYEIQYRDTTEYIYVGKDAIVINGYGYGSIDFTVGQKSFSFRLDLDSTIIHRSENEWGVAKKVDANDNGFSLSDKQVGRYTVRENGIKLENVSFVGEAATFMRLNDLFKYGTATVKVVVSYTNEKNETVNRDFTVGASYFHELNVEKTPDVVTPPVVGHTYDVDSTHTNLYQDGVLYGVKVKFTIKRDGETISKGQYLEWETGLASGTVTGTQVGDNVMLRNTSVTSEAYTAEGWSGTENLKGGTLTSESVQFHFRTAFKAVPGFGASEESVAETNLVFCKRSFDFTDPECPEWAGVHFKVDGDLKVNITEDQVGNDEQAKAEVNGRGLEYEYIGTHYLSFDQFIGTVKVTSQSRAENLLFPKN